MNKNLDPNIRIEIAKNKNRPNIKDIIHLVFKDFVELHGDRLFGDDCAIIGGIATFHGEPVTVIGHLKGKSITDNIKCNFGMPQPEGYRKALRLMKQAEKFGRPIICFVDTPGAHCGVGAEERGQGEAIARNLLEMSSLTVPIVSVVTGEGGSGGALALAVANEVLMLENAVYSVISPRGFASILWKDASREKEAARIMKITSYDLLDLGVIEGVIPEPEGGAHADLNLYGKSIKDALKASLKKLSKLSKAELAEQRYQKYRKIGVFAE
jgi:acetyl-CoA carboxylase carboxyl transferase subunit alpha